MPPYFITKANYQSSKIVDNLHELQIGVSEPAEEEHGSLMLMQTPMRGRKPAIRKLGPCFSCGGNHWLRDCPYKPVINYKGDKLPPVKRHCVGYCVDHLPKVCPHKPPFPPNPRLGPRLNYIEVIPSPYGDEEEQDQASLRVFMRAQAKKIQPTQQDEISQRSQKHSWKRNPKKGFSKKKKHQISRRVSLKGEKQDYQRGNANPKKNGDTILLLCLLISVA